MKSFKIGLFGNMNNNFFVLGRFLQDKGYDVTLLLNTGELNQFNPENDSFYPISLPIQKTEIQNAPSAFWHANNDETRKLGQTFDFLIGCGPSPAYLNKVGLYLDIFIPYGNDIVYVPNWHYQPKDTLRKNVKRWHMSMHQKAGIKRAEMIQMDPTNDDFERILKPLGLSPSQRVYSCTPIIYTPDFSPERITAYYSESKLYPQFKSIRDNNDLVVFSQCRHVWKDTRSLTYNDTTNGNNKLIEGFAIFAKSHPEIRCHLILFEYGTNVKESKSLISQLQIESMVTWFPLSPRKEIMVGISLSDIGVGELDSSYFSYGTIFEFMAMGKPIIHYREDQLYAHYYSNMYPMYSANSVKKVHEHFETWNKNREAFAETGKQANKWFQEFGVQRPLDMIQRAIESKRMHFALTRSNRMSTNTLKRTANSKLHVLCYHGVVNQYTDAHLERNFHTISQFQEQIHYLLNENYHFISAAEFRKRMQTKNSWSLEKEVMITFDDGYKNNINAFNWLKSQQIPCTVFINPGFIATQQPIWTVQLSLLLLKGRLATLTLENKTYELSDDTSRKAAFQQIRNLMKRLPEPDRKSMMNLIVSQFPENEPERLFQEYPSFDMLTWDEIRNWRSDLVAFENHGYDHILFHQEQTIEHVVADLKASNALFNKELDVAPALFAYPNGNCTSDSALLLQQFGYEAAFVLNNVPEQQINSYMIPRITPDHKLHHFIEQMTTDQIITMTTAN